MPALEGLRVIDMATVFAGPGAARHLADFGADVIKVEAPAGDGVRRMGWFPPEGGDSYTWKLLGRNKRAVVADLKTDAGRDAAARARRRRRRADRELPAGHARAARARARRAARRAIRGWCVLRVTGFGQDGPYASRPGFATMAEAMSGFAAINGEPDGPPLLPPIALTDEVTAIAGAFAVMVALHDRERTGLGQVIDVNLLESMLQMMSALPSAAAHLGYEQPRLGSGIPYSVPRGTYRCADDRWVAISTSAESVAHRVLTLLGIGDDPRFATFESRAGHREELDAAVARGSARARRRRCWPRSRRPRPRSRPCTRCSRCWPIRTCGRGTCSSRSTASCMQGPVARLSRTPAEMRWAGRALGADTDAVSRPSAVRPANTTRSPRPRHDLIARAPRDRPPFTGNPFALGLRGIPWPSRRILERIAATGRGWRRRGVSVRAPSRSSRTVVGTPAAARDALPPTGLVDRECSHVRSSLSHPLPALCRTAAPEFAAFHAECAALLARATELDAAQQRACAIELAEVRTKLAELRVVMWPRVDPKDIVHGFRRTHRGGPPPIPPVAPNARPLRGKQLPLHRARRPGPQRETHDARRDPPRAASQRLRDRFAPPGQAARQLPRLRDVKGRARRVDRGVYALGRLNPGDAVGSSTSAGSSADAGSVRRFGCELDAVAPAGAGLRRARGSPGARARPHPARASGSTRRRPRA